MRGSMNEGRLVLRSLLGLLVCALAWGGLERGGWVSSGWASGGIGCGLAAAQDGAAAEKDAPMAKKRSEPKGRLPAYFGEVIDSQQREKVYGIQAKYLAEIKQLQEQIASLEKQREDAVQGVLTPEQAEKVKKLVEEGKAKRADATKRKKGGGAEPSANEAAASR